MLHNPSDACVHGNSWQHNGACKSKSDGVGFGQGLLQDLASVVSRLADVVLLRRWHGFVMKGIREN